MNIHPQTHTTSPPDNYAKDTTVVPNIEYVHLTGATHKYLQFLDVGVAALGKKESVRAGVEIDFSQFEVDL